MEKVTVVILDDHRLVREMWAMIFARHPSIEITGEGGTITEAIDIIKSKRPDIVFLDINLAQESGMDAVPVIRKLSPGTKIIAVSMHNQGAYVKKALRLGVKGYVTKSSSQNEIIEAIQVVIAGGQYICSEVKNIILDQTLDTAEDSTIKKLSIREIEIIGLLKVGRSSKEISSQLHIGIRTVEVHRRNILKKLKLKTTLSMIDFCYNRTNI